MACSQEGTKRRRRLRLLRTQPGQQALQRMLHCHGHARFGNTLHSVGLADLLLALDQSLMVAQVLQDALEDLSHLGLSGRRDMAAASASLTIAKGAVIIVIRLRDRVDK